MKARLTSLFVSLAVISGCSSPTKTVGQVKVQKGYHQAEGVNNAGIRTVIGESYWTAEQHTAKKVAYDQAISKVAFFLSPEAKVNTQLITTTRSYNGGIAVNEYSTDVTDISAPAGKVLSKVEQVKCYYARENEWYLYKYRCMAKFKNSLLH